MVRVLATLLVATRDSALSRSVLVRGQYTEIPAVPAAPTAEGVLSAATATGRLWPWRPSVLLSLSENTLLLFHIELHMLLFGKGEIQDPIHAWSRLQGVRRTAHT